MKSSNRVKASDFEPFDHHTIPKAQGLSHVFLNSLAYHAIKKGNLKKIYHYLKKGWNPESSTTRNVIRGVSIGFKASHESIYYNQLEMLKLLLQVGVSVNNKDNMMMLYPLDMAIKHQDAPAIHEILKKYPDAPMQQSIDDALWTKVKALKAQEERVGLDQQTPPTALLKKRKRI